MTAELLSILFAVLSAVLLAPTFPGTLYLGLLTLAGLLPGRHHRTAPLRGRIALVVPAHNESAVIGTTLANLVTLARQDGNTDVVVIADNCGDDTADLARASGARVIERQDVQRRGKGYALDYGFRGLMPEAFAAFVVVDADSSADANFLPALRDALGDAAVAQVRYLVRNAEASPRTRLAEIALAGFNVLRPRGRARLGLSAGILGNGFALRREVLVSVPYSARSVVEDLEYHLRLIDAGQRVAFVDATSVRGDMPSGGAGARTQRARWEGGRLLMLREHGLALLSKGLRGHWHQFEPLADLTLLPLGHHVLLLAASLVAALGGANVPLALTASLSLAVVAAHVAAAIHVAGLPWSHLASLARVPSYLAWKLGMLGATLAASTRRSEWVRTDRTGH